MKKTLIALLILFFAGCAFAQEFRPATVKSIDVTITTEAMGSLSGTLNSKDELDILYLSIQKDEKQEILSLEEYLAIGNDKIKPSHIQRNGLTYALYEVTNLAKYSQTPEFTITRKARVKRTAEIGLNTDYNLSKKISEFSEYTQPTLYIESNDRELQTKASIEFTSDSQIETIREIAEWVNNNIEYDFANYYEGVYSAKQTYNSRAGVCDEFANLTAAFTRIKGIPTRYVTGVSFDGQRFGMHGWLEVYSPGNGWIGVDSTYGEAGYLDAAHITLAKTSDANNSIDFIATTRSIEPVQLKVELPLPKVEINSVEFFQNLLDAKLTKPEKIGPGETFEISAKIKNISGENAILPIQLVLHEDFVYNDKPRLVWFEKGEEKTITWEARAPELKFEKGYYNFGLLLLMPDGNITDELRVVPNKNFTENGPNIRVKDISPFISGDSLEVKMLFENVGDETGNAYVEAWFDGIQLETSTVEVPKYGEKNFSYIVRKIHEGNVTLRVITTLETKTIELQIPEEPSHMELPAKQDEQTPQSEFPANPAQEAVPQGLLIPGIAAAAVFIIIIAVFIVGARK